MWRSSERSKNQHERNAIRAVTEQTIVWSIKGVSLMFIL